MKKNYNYLVAFVLLNFFCVNAFAQFQKINGNVKNGQSKENVSAASILINGTSTGTFTNDKGNFDITVKSLPATITISAVGFKNNKKT
ncbi:MAG: carboxypeptidase-like regulatory domain-containing protein, partial [Sphingobacteriales bacterium]|nr:carboxypeptidase-like regulatory domain-containing protein [Sphingobacteriales bacterium]